MERKTQPIGLRLQQAASNRMHRNSVRVSIDGHQQRVHLTGALNARDMQSEGAVLAATPTHPRVRSRQHPDNLLELIRTSIGHRRTVCPIERTGAPQGAAMYV